jgi:hypothetical protein
MTAEKRLQFFARINSRIARVALMRINYECERRAIAKGGTVPQSELLTEFGMSLPAHPDENRVAPLPLMKQSAAAKKKRRK